MRSLVQLLGVSLLTISLSPTQLLLAATSSTIPQPSDAPLELDLLQDPKGTVSTAHTISQQKMSTPSLWMEKSNSKYQLLDDWIAYPATAKEPGRVDLIVNQDVWSSLDYLERYSFINRFGSTARKYGYNIRVFNYQKELLATYTCNFSTSPTSCGIVLNTKVT
jgi:gamma-glutamylcyclotransferase (GGCT)/AIG2-like uncharacterized protein YtfP